MKDSPTMILLGIGVLVCSAGYCYALVDWIVDYKTGVYQRQQLEALYETSAILLYTALGIRFINRRINLF